MVINRYNNEEVLYHHGILGQKWGVRRYQNEDGSLTSAGKKRYNVEAAKQNVKQIKKALNKANTITQRNELKRDLQIAKKELSDEKIKTKLNSEKVDSKSKHRLKLERKYIEEGFTPKEAEIAAYKRIKTEKILFGIGTATVAAAAAYVAYRHYDKTVDRLIKPDTILQNISTNSNKGVEDAFYASTNRMDNIKYRGLYGKALNNPSGNSVYETKIKTKSALKLASEKSAAESLSSLVNGDAKYKSELTKYLSSVQNMMVTDKQNNVLKKGLESLNKGIVDKNVYTALNLALPVHGYGNSDTVIKTFYEKLKSDGYDAIKDLNDFKYSGYHSSNPLIIFNGKDKASISSIRKLGMSEIDSAYKKGMGDIALKELGPKVALGAASLAAISAGKNKLIERMNNKKVLDYRKHHPETKLSYTEILKLKG